MIIRDMQPGDLHRVYEINQENIPAVGEESLDRLGQLREYSSIALVIESDEQVVGFCIVLPHSTPYQSPNYLYFCERYTDLIYLDRVAITAEYQGRGWGAQLYRVVEERSTASWFALEVNVVPPNEGSIRFHQRQGFKELSQEETRPGKIVSMMVKAL